jgi:hypothetical protein
MAAVAASVAVLSGGAIAANAAEPTTTTTPSRTCHVSVKAMAAFKELPATLKHDLGVLKSDTGTARRTEAKLIRARALDGYYGATIEARAKALKGKGVRLYASLPASLKVDLKAIHTADTRAEKKVLIKQVITEAEAGQWGAKVEAAAKKIAATTAYETCIAS